MKCQESFAEMRFLPTGKVKRWLWLLAFVMGACGTVVTPVSTLVPQVFHVPIVYPGTVYVGEDNQYDDPLFAEIEVVEIGIIPAGQTQIDQANPSRTALARVVCVPTDKQHCQDRLFIEDLPSGTPFEIGGIPLPHRPISALMWVDNDVLAFDRWSGPHYGWRYAVDVRRNRLLMAVPIYDQTYTQP